MEIILTRENRSTEIDQETTERILHGCTELAPELLGDDGQFYILRLQVGLRPLREGGPRVEAELVDGKYDVVHSYGHSGAGYVDSFVCWIRSADCSYSGTRILLEAPRKSFV